MRLARSDLQTDLLEMMLKVLRDDLEQGSFQYSDERHRESLREIARTADALSSLPGRHEPQS